MKNFNRIFVFLVFAMGLMAIKSAYGASAVVSPKQSFVLAYTTVVTTITPSISTNVAPNAQYAPGAVYQLIQSTGAANTDFFMLYDSSYTQSASGVGISCGQTASLPPGVTALTPHMVYQSTFTTITRFDPPLQFDNGLVGCNNGASDSVGITWEMGRGLNGQ